VNKPKILQPNESYTFSRYFELNAAPRDILADLGHSYARTALALPRHRAPLDWSVKLHQIIERNLKRVNPTSEQSRREVLVAPTLLEVCDFLDIQLEIEYPISVSSWLKGTLDYFIPAQPLLVVEAKQSDLTRGFVQLAVELIAVAQWSDSDQAVFYGAVTTGEVWKFGVLDPAQKSISEDVVLYRSPQDLDELLQILVGILSC
jgi:hypothetical protein